MSQQRPRIYLDNAATSFPKPEQVYDAVNHYQRAIGAAVGRGTTATAREVQQRVDRCRSRLSRLLGVTSSKQVIFTFNGTDALNLALHGLLQPGDHVVTTPWEHNSVLRPLSDLSHTKSVQTSFVDDDGQGAIDLKTFQQALRPHTKLVCVTHASNVTGVIQPVAEIVEMAHRVGALVLLDAAQTVGHLTISMQELGVDLLACPGHKGLLGPLGTGVLAIRSGLETCIPPIRQGGTGTVSELEQQPETLPEKYEAGNHNAPGLFGLEAALNWLESQTIEQIRTHEQKLTQQFLTGLGPIEGIDAYFAEPSVNRVGVVSVNARQLEPQVLATLLDEHFGIETRAGLHCSPRAHAALGTIEQGGTVRFSFGPFNSAEDVDAALEALAQITAAF